MLHLLVIRAVIVKIIIIIYALVDGKVFVNPFDTGSTLWCSQIYVTRHHYACKTEETFLFKFR